MYTIILFITRESSITSKEFQDYYEQKHIPLAFSLLSEFWPTSFHRRYLARINRKGFGGPANPDRPPLTLRGEMQELDCDCIAEMTWPDEKGFQHFYKKLYEKEIAAVLAEDERKFLEEGKTTAVVVGETWSMGLDGVTRSEKSDISGSDVSDVAMSSSEQSG
ncbi:hypothetical protein CC86DRAFT_454286 [Ophiobolus disseminans]|uniref:EthD domain-containing protein n=1 Tax=Ophiobolus disseminans TaxID=1469910 RepID=A0A6A7A5D2_9PLEO|nr:hypothetical protein CC86DRAFT_454286 [Ophiobolus disseminans]